jgi:hypothetical protein
MKIMSNRILSFRAWPNAIVACLLSTAAAAAGAAELTPEWLARLPVGASLTAGMTGMGVDAAGV